jgi:hypothetical protein|tara:strand:+ start:848 stop:1102 length:255 start_codon:yes stop_codon:yes gene_type:complete
MLDTLTPFEEAILNAHDFGASLAATFVISDLVKKNDDLRLKKRDVPISGQTMTERKALIAEIRRNNQALAIVAQLNEMNFGISG